MAEADISVARGQFSCPICRDLLEDPVALLCGHSFCMKCINACWDQEDQKGVYSCPQCKETFTSRPAVSKNTMLAEVVETLQKTILHAAPAAPFSSGPEDVECDSCTEKKHKAIKSCLVCLASFCETHLQPHYKSPAFKKHKLVEASRRLQEQICSQHDKLLEVYCRTDQKCICMLCMLDEHKGHDTVSAAAGRAEKQVALQTQLLEMQGKSRQRIQDREKELQEHRKAVESHKNSTQTAVEETERNFLEVIKLVERRRCEIIWLIRAQEKAVVSQAEEVMKHLEQEIAELKKKIVEIEGLLHKEDPIQYLQSFESVLADPGCADFPNLAYSPLTFEKVLKSVSQLKEKVETFLYDDWKISTEDSLFAFASLSKLTFADLAMMSGGFSFNKKVPNISLPTARAAVFSTKTTPSHNEEEDKEGKRDDVYFKPVASLPKVKVKSGQEDEKIIFKQRAKLFRWDRDICQWKERGVGDLKILFHPVKKLYRVLMRRDQILKVCANHNITKDIELKPMNMSANALVWMANDYAEGDAKVEQLAAKFKTPELADTFKRSFTDCQRCMSHFY